MKLICLLLSMVVLALGAKTELDEQVCHSTNGAIVKNFHGEDFEFDNTGTHLVYNSGRVKIEAEYKKDEMDINNVCRVKVEIIATGRFAELDTCAGIELNNVRTNTEKLELPLVDKQSQSEKKDFKFETTLTYYSIKTNVGNTNQDVELRVYKDYPTGISRYEIYASKSYALQNYRDKDCSLCGKFNLRFKEENQKRLRTECIKSLFNTHKLDEIKAHLDEEGVGEMEEFIDYCIKDTLALSVPADCITGSETGEWAQIGHFQKDLIDPKISQSLTRIHKKEDLDKESHEIFAKMESICAIREKKFNHKLREAIYDRPFRICH